MSKSSKLSVRGFWIGTGVMFCVVTLIHSHFYVIPDAISTATGTMLAAYIMSYIVWHVAKYIIAPERVPERLWFIFVFACVLVAIIVWNNFKS